MKWILKQAAWLLAGVAFLYAIILAVSLAVVPMHRQEGGLETRRAAATLYMTEPKYLFLSRVALRSDEDRLILLGASNMMTGFRLDELQPLVPHLQVNNLAVSGSNVTEMRQAYDMIRAVQSPTSLKRSTFVIGIWYGVFVPDALKWNTPDRHAGETDLDIERFRYGFFRRSADGPVQVLPTDELELGLVLIHPSLAFDKLTRELTAGIRGRFLKMKPVKTEAQKNAIVIGPEDQARYLAFWRDQFGGSDLLSREQFNVLTALVDEILADGAMVVAVDLPIPEWLARRSPLNRSYNVLRSAWLREMADRKGFFFVDMQGAFSAEEFVDEVHPKPRITKEWSSLLAAAISNETATAGNGP